MFALQSVFISNVILLLITKVWRLVLVYAFENASITWPLIRVINVSMCLMSFKNEQGKHGI